MKKKDVPQEHDMYGDHLRACYAQNEKGDYEVVTSAGWDVESVVNTQANNELRHDAEQTRQDVIAGKASPLEFHMKCRQMTPSMLAVNAGIWQWRVKRHLKPAGFKNLSNKFLAQYADALAMTVDELRSVPTEAVKDIAYRG